MTQMVVAIAPPGQLDPALVESLRNAWGGGAVDWLSPDEAAEFSVAAVPDNQWEVWDDLQKLQVDLAVVPCENRRKKLLIADMDSTMIGQECIDELADEAGVGEQVKAITARAMDGELDFDGALRERVGLLKGLNTSVIADVLANRISLTTGGPELLATMKAYGAFTALVSGGFTDFTQVIAEKLGFDAQQANRLLMDGDVLTGDVGTPILGREAKVEALDTYIKAQGLTLQECIAVGDGANDLGMLGLAGMGVALHAKPSVAAACDLRINFGDLTALLFLQGYARSEFVSAQ